MKVIDRTKAVTQVFLENSFKKLYIKKKIKKIRKTQKYRFFFLMYVASWCCTCFCVVLWVSFCTGNFVMVPLNMTYLHCLQHSFFEHPFNLYCISDLKNYNIFNKLYGSFFILLIMYVQ